MRVWKMKIDQNLIKLKIKNYLMIFKTIFKQILKDSNLIKLINNLYKIKMFRISNNKKRFQIIFYRLVKVQFKMIN